MSEKLKKMKTANLFLEVGWLSTLVGFYAAWAAYTPEASFKVLSGVVLIPCMALLLSKLWKVRSSIEDGRLLFVIMAITIGGLLLEFLGERASLNIELYLKDGSMLLGVLLTIVPLIPTMLFVGHIALRRIIVSVDDCTKDAQSTNDSDDVNGGGDFNCSRDETDGTDGDSGSDC